MGADRASEGYGRAFKGLKGFVMSLCEGKTCWVWDVPGGMDENMEIFTRALRDIARFEAAAQKNRSAMDRSTDRCGDL